MSELNSSPALKRSFGMREAVTITAGSVIGVGLFTVGSNIVGLMGPSVIFATVVALLISVYPALLYAEMGAALPYAGGTYQFASVGIGRAAGVLAGWNFIISLVAVTGGEALAFSYYFKTLFSAFGVTLPFSDVAIAVVITAGFIVANVCGVKIAGRLQNGFMFFFWGVAAIWFLTMIPNINLPSFVQAPSFLPKDGQMSFAASVCMIWWCFAGFEACVPAHQYSSRALFGTLCRVCGQRAFPMVPDRHHAGGKPRLFGHRSGTLCRCHEGSRHPGVAVGSFGSGRCLRRRLLHPERRDRHHPSLRWRETA